MSRIHAKKHKTVNILSAVGKSSEFTSACMCMYTGAVIRLVYKLELTVRGRIADGTHRIWWTILTTCWIFHILYNRLAELPSVLWRCWLRGRKGIPPVKN